MMPIYDELPTYRCRRISAAWAVDGDLSKSVWKSTPAIELMLAGGTGKPLQSTTVRGCWDGENLYLAFECVDSDIRATFTQRNDRVWQEEAVEAFIAPYGDLRHYYEFQCSPNNVVRDVKVTNPNVRGENMLFDGSWDCTGWQTAVTKRFALNDPLQAAQGWHAEWRISLGKLLDPEAGPILAGEEWRVNVYRIDRWPREEYSSWSAVPGLPLSFHRPTYFGRWIFE
jgi:hypothetical protein